MRLPRRLTGLHAGESITLALHLRQVDFTEASSPEMHLSRIESLGQWADAGGLVRFLERLPGSRTAGFSWWAIDQQETCAFCARRFDTGRRHWAMAITVGESACHGGGPVACWYPERYCPDCQPPGGPCTAWPAQH